MTDNTEARVEWVREVEQSIEYWSMRPQPGTPTGEAWEHGAVQGYLWGRERAMLASAPPAPPDALKVAVEALGSALESEGYVLRPDDDELYADRYAGGHWQHLNVSKLALAALKGSTP